MKRFLSLFLALLMIFSSCTLLFSCKEDKEDEKKDDGKKNEEELVDDGSIFYERSLVDDGIEDYDYEGKSFRVASIFYATENYVIPDEKLNKGDLLLDTKHERTQKVADRFNVNFEVVYSGTYQEVDEYVSKTVLSATDEFDLMEGMVTSMASLVIKDLFLNWYEIDHIDFSRPWWYESNATELTYDDKAVIAVSHLNYDAVAGSICLFFNKDMAEAYDLGNLYDVVLEGDWTFDYFTSLVKDIYADDGNDIRDENDTYGMVQGTGGSINSYLWAFDNPVCKKNEEGVPQVSVMTDKIDGIVNEIYDFCFNTNGVYCDPKGNNGGYTQYVYDLFYGKKAIFMQANLNSATSEEMRNFDSNYGILPLPKWDENQQDYHTMVNGGHTALAVPKTVKDTEFVGRIVEALSAESWKLVTPTLYETALKTRYLRDSESKKVMDIIIEGTQFDFGTVYDGWKGFAFMLQMMMTDSNKNFRSYYAMKQYNAKKQIKDIIKAFDKLD